LSKFHFVIPNRAESPVRNLLFAGQTAGSSRNKTAPRNDTFKLTHYRKHGLESVDWEALLGGAQTEPKLKPTKTMERETGIEPATTGLGSRCSTIELLPRPEQLARR
jgi:hypothetical protein